MSAPNIPTRIMMFRDFVPDRVRVFLCLFFAVTFQFSGGIYLASVSQMVGSLALMQEDIMMAGYASFVGTTVVFPILFRLKFRFTSRSIFLMVCPALIVCNLITMSTGSLPVLVGVCFIAGMFRMWGTFECLSNVQLSITPTRNFAVFFPVVYLIVLGSIQLSGLATVYLGYWADWRYMHGLIIGLLLVVWLCAALFPRHFRFMKALPLYGIDWLGGILWAIFLLALAFVFEYGKFYDWLYSPYIRSGIVVAVVALLLNINRMHTLRHPYITKEALGYRNMGAILLAFLVLCCLQTTPTILQNIFTGSILKYDVLNSMDRLNLDWEAQKNNIAMRDIGGYPSNPQFGTGDRPSIPNYLTQSGAQGSTTIDPSDYDYPTTTYAPFSDADWWDELDRAAMIQNHQIGLSGGTEKGQYNLSANYFKQDGTVIDSYYQRYQVRANTSFNVRDWLRVGENLTYAFTKDNGLSANGAESNPYSWTYRASPWVPVYDIAGNFAGSKFSGTGNFQNPVANQVRNKDNYYTRNRITYGLRRIFSRT